MHCSAAQVEALLQLAAELQVLRQPALLFGLTLDESRLGPRHHGSLL